MVVSRRRSRCRYVLALLLFGLPCSIAPARGWATFWLGDLVYCDLDRNGSFSALDGDFPLNGIEVRAVCADAKGFVCADFTTVTGTRHGSTVFPFQTMPASFAAVCAEAFDLSGSPYDPLDPAELDGRYLFELPSRAFKAPIPMAIPSSDRGLAPSASTTRIRTSGVATCSSPLW